VTTATRRCGGGYTGRDANAGLVPNTRAPDVPVCMHARARARTRARTRAYARVRAHERRRLLMPEEPRAETASIPVSLLVFRR